MRAAASGGAHNVLPPVAGGGSGASFAIDRGAAGTGADREGGWPVEERLRTDGGEAAAGPRARVRRAHPHLKPVVMQDALGATAPQLSLCQQLDLRFLIAVKPGSHAHLFEAIGSGTEDEWFADDSEDGRRCARQLRLVHDVPLNEAHRDTVRDTVLQAQEVPPKGRTAGQPRTWTRITDLPLTRAEASEAQACARSRWKIENETFKHIKEPGLPAGTQFRTRERAFGHGADAVDDAGVPDRPAAGNGVPRHPADLRQIP